MEKSEIFDSQEGLPCEKLSNFSKTLIGFSRRYKEIQSTLQIMLSPDDVNNWSKEQYGRVIPLCEVIQQRYPLFIFSGDVGTGKTATAECSADQLTRDMEREGFLLKLNTRVRGRGLHGEMTQLIQNAFEELKVQAGKKRLAFLLIDEADSMASLRSTEQMHQEEKAGVNTLIQQIDQLRQVGGRAIVFLCTNRVNVIDQAIVRRSAMHVEFSRPNKGEILELLTMDLSGLGLTDGELGKLASLTAPGGDYGDDGYTFSDFRMRLFPKAVASCFPDKKLTFDGLKETISLVKPSPKAV